MDKTLSIFVDESGDFGAFESHAPYYIFSLVMHDQSHSIAQMNSHLDQQLIYAGFSPHCFHTMPLIRGEIDYHALDLKTRRKLLNYLFTYLRAAPIHYSTILVEKRKETDVVGMTISLSGKLYQFISYHMGYFNSFDKMIVYYDKGQVELTRLLVSVFTIMFHSVEFRKVEPSAYRLFQVADLCCTMELIRAKYKNDALNKSEIIFFGNKKNLKKNYLNHLDTLQMP